MASYLDKLRNSNVFGNPFSPSRQNPFALVDQFMRRNPQLNNIGQQMLDDGGGGRNMGGRIQEPSQEKPMNYRFVDQEIQPLDRAKLDLRRAELEGRQDLGKGNLGIKRDEVGIKRDQLAINDFKSKNPGMKIESQKGGNFFAINPITGETKDLGINTGTWSDEEVSNAKGQQALEQIGARGGEDRTTEGVRQTGRVELAGVKGEEQRKTKETPGSATDYPSQEKVRQHLKAQEAKNTHPEWRKYITLGQGDFLINPPGGWSGPSPEIYKAINDFIYGSSDSGKTKETTPPKVETKVPVAPKGWKYIPKKGGGWTAVEDKGGV